MPEVKVPGPDHPIAIAPHRRRVVVRLGGVVVAATERALLMREHNHRPVFYVPREDAAMTFFTRADRASYCPQSGSRLAGSSSVLRAARRSGRRGAKRDVVHRASASTNRATAARKPKWAGRFCPNIVGNRLGRTASPPGAAFLDLVAKSLRQNDSSKA